MLQSPLQRPAEDQGARPAEPGREAPLPSKEPDLPEPSPTDLPERLLALARATSEDGGAEVLRVLRAVLAEQVSFDAGEVAIRSPTGCERWALADAADDLVGEDLLLRASVSPGPLKIDDLAEAEAFPRTLANMKRGGYRSLLLLPLSSAGGVEGAVVLARRFAWAFAGAPLPRLSPLARMAGLALDRALVLTELGRDIDGLRAREDALRSEIASLQSELAVARGSAERLRRRLLEVEAERDAGSAQPRAEPAAPASGPEAEPATEAATDPRRTAAAPPPYEPEGFPAGPGLPEPPGGAAPFSPPSSDQSGAAGHRRRRRSRASGGPPAPPPESGEPPLTG